MKGKVTTVPGSWRNIVENLTEENQKGRTKYTTGTREEWLASWREYCGIRLPG